MIRRMAGACQTTVASEIILSGKGVHSGAVASVVIHSADADTGLRFVLTRNSKPIADIPADYRSVANATLCTVLADKRGNAVATVEHLLAAMRGLGVDNAYIEIDSSEVPIMDGSAAPFVAAIDDCGIRELNAPRKFIKVLKPIRVEDGDCWGELSPYHGFSLDVEIDFDTPLIGRQRLKADLTPTYFRDQLSSARTFGFMRDVEKLWAAGKALGASLDNTVAIADDRVVNPNGLRFVDEFVRHKTLDAVGDLALSGPPLLGSYRSLRGGHRLNTMMLKAMFADRSAWAYEHAPMRPWREPGRPEAGFALSQAFAADRS